MTAMSQELVTSPFKNLEIYLQPKFFPIPLQGLIKTALLQIFLCVLTVIKLPQVT